MKEAETNVKKKRGHPVKFQKFTRDKRKMKRELKNI